MVEEDNSQIIYIISLYIIRKVYMLGKEMKDDI